jgi:hypothetical protein
MHFFNSDVEKSSMLKSLPEISFISMQMQMFQIMRVLLQTSEAWIVRT